MRLKNLYEPSEIEKNSKVDVESLLEGTCRLNGCRLFGCDDLLHLREHNIHVKAVGNNKKELLWAKSDPVDITTSKTIPPAHPCTRTRRPRLRIDPNRSILAAMASGDPGGGWGYGAAVWVGRSDF